MIHAVRIQLKCYVRRVDLKNTVQIDETSLDLNELYLTSYRDRSNTSDSLFNLHGFNFKLSEFQSKRSYLFQSLLVFSLDINESGVSGSDGAGVKLALLIVSRVLGKKTSFNNFKERLIVSHTGYDSSVSMPLLSLTYANA